MRLPLIAALLLACALPLVAAPANMLRNAGFMQCTNPGIPDWWGTGTPERVTNWAGNYGTTPDSPVPGTAALMLRNVEGQSGWSVQSYLHRGLKAEGDYALAVWLKGDSDDMPATLGMGNAHTTLKVSREWKRYTWIAKPGPAEWGTVISFSVPKGTLWIAAPMWTEGSEAAEFAPHPADVPATAPTVTPARPTPTVPVATATIPLYPGRAHASTTDFSDPFWSKATVLSPFVDVYSGAAAKTQTKAHLIATQLGLYIGLECTQPDMAHVQITGDKPDGNVYGGECVEVFIAPERNAGPYFHFALNPNGVKADEMGIDPSWNALWGASTTKHPDGWTASLWIPWQQLPIGAKADTKWAMNICRHAKAAAEELSEWSFTDGNFHNAPRFGLVTVPKSIAEPGAMDLAFAGTWTEGRQWGFTLKITPGPRNSGRRTVGAVVFRPGVKEMPPPGSEVTTTVDFTPGKPVLAKLGPVRGRAVAGVYRAMVSVATDDPPPAPPLLLREIKFAALETPAATAPAAALSALLDHSYYTTETAARLRVWSAEPRVTEARAEFAGKTFAAKLLPGAPGKWCEIALPLAGIPDGETTVRVSLVAADGTAPSVSWQDKLTKLAAKPFGCKVDRFARCFIVDGKPFVPYCMGIHSIKQIDRLQDIKDHGFNSVCAIFSGTPTEKDLADNHPTFDAFLAACRKLDLKVIWWNGGGGSYERHRDGLIRNMKAYQADDLILAWYVLDEPEGWWEASGHKEGDLALFHDAVTAADPYRPSFLNYYAWKKGYGGYGGLAASDVGSLDRYPIGRGDAMKAMDDITSLMTSDCWPVGKPVSIWLQLYGYDDAIREATPAEQRCQTYISLIDGARSVLYFIYKPMCVAMWDSMLPLGQEIEKLTPVFAAPPPERDITVDTDKIRYMLRQVDGMWYIVAANRTNEPVKATFDLTNLKVTGPAGVMFTRLAIPFRGGKLIDDFPPLATRAYVIGAGR